MALQPAVFDVLRFGEKKRPPTVNPARYRQKERDAFGDLLLALLLFCAIAARDAPAMGWLATPSP